MKTFSIYINEPTPYIMNMNGHKGKANIHCEKEPDNEYDPKAVKVFTFNRDNTRIDLGYIQKRRFEGYEYKKSIKEEYEDWYNSVYEDLEENGHSAELEDWMDGIPGLGWWLYNRTSYKEEDFSDGRKYETILDDFEVEILIQKIKSGVMRFRSDYKEKSGWLFEKE